MKAQTIIPRVRSKHSICSKSTAGWNYPTSWQSHNAPLSWHLTAMCIASRCIQMQACFAPEIVIFRANRKQSQREHEFVLRVLLLCRRFSQCERRKNNFLGALWKPSLIKASVRRHQSQRRKWSQLPPSRSLSVCCVCFFLACLRILLSTKEESAPPSSYSSGEYLVISDGKKTAAGSRCCSGERFALIFTEFHLRLRSAKSEEVLRNVAVVAVCR